MFSGKRLIMSAAASVLVSAIAAIAPAHAGVMLTDTLNNLGTCDSCGTGPAGTVTVAQDSPGSVLQFTVALNSGYTFARTGGIGDAFSFNLATNGVATNGNSITTLESPFAVDTSLPQNNTPFGLYNYGIQFNAGTTNPTSTLTFDVAYSGTLSASTFLQSTDPANGHTFIPAFFTVDVLFNSDIDPNVGATAAPVSAVPEPSTWAMMILGFCGLGFLAYRRNQNGPMLRIA
jgi:hypothetical protein